MMKKEQKLFETDAKELRFEVHIKVYNGMIETTVIPGTVDRPAYMEILGALEHQKMNTVFQMSLLNMERWIALRKETDEMSKKALDAMPNDIK